MREWMIRIYLLVLTFCYGCIPNQEAEKHSPVSEKPNLSKPVSAIQISSAQKIKETTKAGYGTFWERSKKEFPFQDYLELMRDTNSIHQIKTGIDSVARQRKSTSVSSTDKWELGYYLIEGWYGIPILQVDSADEVYVSKQSVHFSTADIFEVFDIPFNKFPLDFFPMIFGRDAKFNKEWIAISTDPDYLMILLVSSYPDGNQTSCHFQKMYLFRKKVI